MTVVLTILTEALVIIGYARWRHKPLTSLLLTGVLANIFTQSLLWLALTFSPLDYLPTLLLAEIVIWLIEVLIVFFIRTNELTFRQSIFLSLAMNLASFGIGWMFPL